ncbi:hypothetical protein SGPA1_50071 [Streptomyces misionensis JCM 4497]
MDAGERGLVDRPVNFQFESLSLTYVRDPFESQARQRTLDRLALGVEDLRLEHDVDYDACHWHSRCVVLSRFLQTTRTKFLRE